MPDVVDTAASPGEPGAIQHFADNPGAPAPETTQPAQIPVLAPTARQVQCAMGKVALSVLGALTSVCALGVSMVYVPGGVVLLCLAMLVCLSKPLVWAHAASLPGGSSPDDEVVNLTLIGRIALVINPPLAGLICYASSSGNENHSVLGNNSGALICSVLLSVLSSFLVLLTYKCVFPCLKGLRADITVKVLLVGSAFLAAMVYVPWFAPLFLAGVALLAEKPLVAVDNQIPAGQIRWLLRGGLVLSLLLCALMHISQSVDQLENSVFGQNVIAMLFGPALAVVLLALFWAAEHLLGLVYQRALVDCMKTPDDNSPA